MKFRNNAKTGSFISITLSVIALLLFIIVNIVPNVDYNTLDYADQFAYDMGVYKSKTPLWETICEVIAIFLIILSIIIESIMCRCSYCGNYIRSISTKKYCPYCSKSLDPTVQEIITDINSKKE